MVPTQAPLHLAVALDGAGWHSAAWREPDAQPDRLFTAGYWAELAQQAERGLLDFLTIEDGLDLQSDDHFQADSRTAEARELATGYGLWVRSIRTAEGAIQFPAPEQARRHVWSDADRELVADRVDTQFTGTPGQVADQLERLRDATEADELIITTITHDHADRVRSYQLLAEEWARR
jgi:alkanesulfonate monooxygenase SsuD/methylene tetrahydromethanopterin reductase-like flavin-dependent oxidoreductase (luciferase family)